MRININLDYKLTLKPILLIIILLVVLYVIYHFWYKLNKMAQLKKSTIVSAIGEPYLMEESISPLTITLTNDIPNNNGGLSYLKKYTNDLNIRLIHDMYKHSYNMELPKDTHIIFGAGTTMMIGALYYALQKKLGHPIYANTNSDVFYMLHEHITLSSKNITWVSKNEYADLAVIVSPSNPMGTITSPNELKQKYKLYDIVYDKYLFTGKHKSINEGLFEEFAKDDKIYITTSFSKLGLAGVRFGFLLTRDSEIAEYCREYVKFNGVRYPTAGATISRLAYYKYFNKKDWEENIYNTLKERRQIFYHFALKHGINIYYKNDLVPYIYTDKSKEWWLKNFNVETRKGSDFNDTDNNSRFNLMLTKENWAEFERRFSSVKS